MKEPEWTIIKPLIVEATVSLFGAAGAYVIPGGNDPAATGHAGVAAFVGITSAQIRGGIGLTLPCLLIERTHPIRRVRLPDEREVRDWACEMTNQLAGRVKTQLLARGIAFRSSTAMAVLGKDLHLPEPLPEQEYKILGFTYLRHPLYVHFAAQITPGVALREKPVGDDKDAREGDVILF